MFFLLQDAPTRGLTGAKPFLEVYYVWKQSLVDLPTSSVPKALLLADLVAVYV